MIPDRFFYPLAALVIAGLIAAAMVYPQGRGETPPAKNPVQLRIKPQ
jgi:hypothetical protein